ncbi:MAG: ATP-dependent Clp protease proteolytic subunit [Selenomonadaceae bacterium]|nr:ATP-dependent Clp protease proteolytic subunit [Selenomonadaceae bacterium]
MKNSDIKINFTGNVNEENARAFINELKNLITENPESTSLTIYISSPGGSVDIAVELFHFLKLLDCKIRTVNISCVNSAAVIIFAAGEERISLPCSSFYVHSVSKHLSGDFTADDLLREAREMSANTDKVATILANISNKNKSYWKRLMKKGCLLTSKKAKELGLVNDISEYK